MMEAALLSGLAIASTRTTLAHSISYPLTLHFGIPHGLACAFTIIQVLRFNAEENPDRLDQIALLIGSKSSTRLADELETLLMKTGAYRWMGKFLKSNDEVIAIAPECMTPGRADNNPRMASVDDVRTILSDAWSFIDPVHNTR
ncbi:MAG: iron-containing alcohol dehydrogenase [Planctomycetes bacterium]|nr:iron-containing alcohol dehydrogenase [Planctomycetota bacterium]